MIIWLNGAFGAGKTTCASELSKRIPGSFVYDPENVGYFLRRNLPKSMHKGDFQDHAQWRGFNYELLRYMSSEYDGAVIAPMTLVDPQYFDEIIGRLRRGGVEVRHFILCASRETLEKRLRSRSLFKKNTWALRQIGRCIDAFENDITEERVETDGVPIERVVDEIGARLGISLLPDHRGALKRGLDRAAAQIGVIRWLFKP